MLVGPPLHRRDLVAVGEPIGKAAALHDGAVVAHLEGEATVDVTKRKFADEDQIETWPFMQRCL